MMGCDVAKEAHGDSATVPEADPPARGRARALTPALDFASIRNKKRTRRLAEMSEGTKSGPRRVAAEAGADRRGGGIGRSIAPALPFGVPAIDAALPGGGLARGRAARGAAASARRRRRRRRRGFPRRHPGPARAGAAGAVVPQAAPISTRRAWRSTGSRRSGSSSPAPRNEAELLWAMEEGLEMPRARRRGGRG